LLTSTNVFYVKDGDAYFNDASSNQIRLTSGGALDVGGVGGIGGDYGTTAATVFYTDASLTYFFQDSSAAQAKIDIGSLDATGVHSLSGTSTTIDSTTIAISGVTTFTGVAKGLSNVSDISANYTILDGDLFRTIAMTTGASDKTVTLPTVADNDGRIVTVKKVDSDVGNVIVASEGSETIDGSTSDTILSGQYDSVTLQSNGAQWLVLNSVKEDALIAAKSADYTILDGDGYGTVEVTTSTSTITITLPAVANNTGRTISIKKVDGSTGKVSLNGAGSEEVDGSTTDNELLNQYDVITVISNGTQWLILSERLASTDPSYIRLGGQAALGSTHAKIITHPTTTHSGGTEITYTRDTANGDDFEVASAGLYNMSVTYFCPSASNAFGFSLNAAGAGDPNGSGADLRSTNIQSVAVANRLQFTNTNTVDAPDSLSWIGYLAANDVVRFHTQGSAVASSETRYILSFSKIS
jgi:hypothetical protein